jgi:hypothetical protein
MLVRESGRDELAEYLEAWRAEILAVPVPRMHRVESAVAALTEPGEHMPTVRALRVVAPRFPRLAATVRWVTTVGAIVAATVCFSTALLLIIGMRTGVLQP